MTAPRRIRSTSTGASPVFTTCPPTIHSTDRRRSTADPIASTTARKLSAWTMRGSSPTNAPNVRAAASAGGGAAKCSASTLLGRPATGTGATCAKVRLGNFSHRGPALVVDAGFHPHPLPEWRFQIYTRRCVIGRPAATPAASRRGGRDDTKSAEGADGSPRPPRSPRATLSCRCRAGTTQAQGDGRGEPGASVRMITGMRCWSPKTIPPRGRPG